MKYLLLNKHSFKRSITGRKRVKQKQQNKIWFKRTNNENFLYFYKIAEKNCHDGRHMRGQGFKCELNGSTAAL
jgi:hypothetical protein